MEIVENLNEITGAIQHLDYALSVANTWLGLIFFLLCAFFGLYVSRK